MNHCRVIVTLITIVLTARAGSAGQPARTAFEYHQTGSRAFVAQQLDVAIDALTRSLTLDPKQLKAVRLLGLSYQLVGKLDQAESEFKEACRLAPKDAEAWFYLGRLYYIQNFFDKAL